MVLFPPTPSFSQIRQILLVIAAESSSHPFAFYVRSVWPTVYANSICTTFFYLFCLF
jgi:hypothetical protein